MKELGRPVTTDGKYLKAILDELRELNSLLSNQKTGTKTKPKSDEVELREPKSEKAPSKSKKTKK